MIYEFQAVEDRPDPNIGTSIIVHLFGCGDYKDYTLCGVWWMNNPAKIKCTYSSTKVTCQNCQRIIKRKMSQ